MLRVKRISKRRTKVVKAVPTLTRELQQVKFIAIMRSLARRNRGAMWRTSDDRERKQVLVEFIEQLQKKGFWTKTNNCEWAAVVKVTDIYEIAAEYGVGVEK